MPIASFYARGLDDLGDLAGDIFICHQVDD